MTEMLKSDIVNREFSRETFLKGGGALIVGFGIAGAAIGRRAGAADGLYASNGPPDHYHVDSWIAVHADNTASVKSGAILQGTGSETGILMIAAEELDLDLSQVKHVQADTNVVPQTGAKVASNTIVHAGPGVRAAAAHARQALLAMASQQLGVQAASLSVSKGVVSGGGRSVTYGQLLGGKLFNVRMPESYNMVSRNTGPFVRARLEKRMRITAMTGTGTIATPTANGRTWLIASPMSAAGH